MSEPRKGVLAFARTPGEDMVENSAISDVRLRFTPNPKSIARMSLVFATCLASAWPAAADSARDGFNGWAEVP